ncbi:MAG: dicarboxylate/amino acid:cation symporter [Aerococcus sp.]|nr:dicarboxylate/amino acid:cation symporter [Aerococcus sp.]
MLEFLGVLVTLALFYVLHLMKKKGLSLTIRVLTATAMAVVVGLVFKGHTEYIALFGHIFANILKAFVIPFLLFSVTATVSSIGSLSKLGTIGSKTFGVLSTHNILASITAIAFAFIMGLGDPSIANVAPEGEVREIPPLTETIMGFFPSNLAEHVMELQVIPIVIFAVIIGASIILYKNKDELKPMMAFIESGRQLMNAVIGNIVGFTPYAILSLIADQVGGLDLSFVTSLLWLLLVVILACFFHSFITTPVLVALLGHVNPLIFIRKVFPVWSLGAGTQSSVSTLPAIIDVDQKMGAKEEIVSFAGSVGVTFGMPGCAAIWPVTLAIFSINSLGIEFTIVQYLTMIGVALLVSLGTVGVPGTATITATGMLAAMGLPLEMILIIAPISGIADIFRTATNVEAAASTGIIVSSMEGELDMKRYNA